MTHVLHQGNGWHTRAPIVQTNTGDNSDGKSNNAHHLLFLFFGSKIPGWSRCISPELSPQMNRACRNMRAFVSASRMRRKGVIRASRRFTARTSRHGVIPDEGVSPSLTDTYKYGRRRKGWRSRMGKGCTYASRCPPTHPPVSPKLRFYGVSPRAETRFS